VEAGSQEIRKERFWNPSFFWFSGFLPLLFLHRSRRKADFFNTHLGTAFADAEAGRGLCRGPVEIDDAARILPARAHTCKFALACGCSCGAAAGRALAFTTPSFQALPA
jgi:hypothetical protein